ncbi:M23 family metallopeptidase [Myxococcaceae bacterium JPH2]|nr:M23 family metallopeptidase [Myxococcaceae bacterium JPH2]
MRRPAVLSLMLLSACATPRAEKMSFDELYATARGRPDDATAMPEARERTNALSGSGRSLLLAPEPALELQRTLTDFAEQAKALRKQVKRGSAMPADEARNWERMNAALDAFLARPVERTDSRDVARARSVLEAELEQDARLYGDMSSALAEGVVLRVGGLAVRMAELRRLEHPPEPVGGPPTLVWPVEPVTVTSLYGERWHPIINERRRHLGVDLAARPGQAIYTAAKGVVLRAGWNGDHGLQVEVQHAGPWVTRYSHMSQVLVQPGEVVERGDALGLAGDTGLATGVHLHFELWHGGESMDPLDALGTPDAAGSEPVAHGGSAWPATHQGRHPTTSGQRP